MGGTAFGLGSSDRFDSETFKCLVKKIYSDLEENNYKFEMSPSVIRSYKNKNDFGDIDFLYCGDKESVKSLIYNNFVVLNESKNGSVSSYLVEFEDKKLQLDFIRASLEEYLFTYNYFSFNDLGNLIGRLAHRIGLKFGHNGLFYVQRIDNSILLKEHLLTRDFNEALRYLDLDPRIFHNGFYDLEDIFKFVVTSKYFDYKSVELSQRNNVSRTRDRKRKSYNAFLTWLKDNNLTEYNTELLEKDAYLDQHCSYFPQLKLAIDQEFLNYNNQKEFKQYFNGYIISELTGLQGKELGQFMSYVKETKVFNSVPINILSNSKFFKTIIGGLFTLFKETK